MSNAAFLRNSHKQRNNIYEVVRLLEPFFRGRIVALPFFTVMQNNMFYVRTFSL